MNKYYFKKFYLYTEKMCFLDKFCCICMNKSDLKHLFEVDNDGVSYYNKLTSSIIEMNFKEMNNQRLICGECCIILNTVYNFRQMCLRSKTNLITYISQLQTFDHISGRIGVCSKYIKSELIVVKNWERSENEVKEECESEDDASSAHKDATADHVNESLHSHVKVEDVEHETKMEEDYSEYYTKFNKIEIEEHNLEELKEEPMSDTGIPEDGSSSQADTGTAEEPLGTELTHQCEICQRSFKHKHSLMNHIKSHSGKKSYECGICKKTFSFMCYLTTHMASHTNERPYKCEICKKGFKLKDSLTIHMNTHSSETPYECEICKKSFKNNCNRIKHMKSHSSKRPYECEICKKGFNYKSSLTTHMDTHSSERPYECEICKKDFKHKFNLTGHMKTHSSIRTYACELCMKSFKHKDNFTQHMKTHSNERPYECEICKKSFNYKSCLTVHTKTHSSERPYECGICKKDFKCKLTLNGHMKTHSSKRPYECEICKRRFDKETSCIRHMKRHSDVKS